MAGDVSDDGGAWPGLRIGARLAGGHRGTVHEGEIDGRRVVVRRSRRSVPSLEWELAVRAAAAHLSIGVAPLVPTVDGALHVDGQLVEGWVDGRLPGDDRDRGLIAAALARLHAATVGWPQRPECCRVDELRWARASVDADVDALPVAVRDAVLAVLDGAAGGPHAVIHGDPDPGNIRIDGEDRVWLLDWDESRVDAVALDLADLGVAVLDPAEHRRAQVLAHAWEVVNGWVVEPAYARRRLAALEEALGRDR